MVERKLNYSIRRRHWMGLSVTIMLIGLLVVVLPGDAR